MSWLSDATRRRLRLATIGLLGLALALGIGLLLTKVPSQLEERTGASARVYDRNGLLLARTRGSGGDWYLPLEFEEFGPHVASALLAAEDARFWSHPGVDPLAITRALGQALTTGRIVSGASTITQQLVRTTLPPLPPWVRKVVEAWLSLRVELSLSKQQILELYANRVHFGPQVLGLRAAAERYFGKEPSELDLSEAATLAGLVRGPSLYDLERRPELARRRRDRVLERMQSRGFISEDALGRARLTPISLKGYGPMLGAEHWVRFVRRKIPGQEVLHTTLDLPLQRELERLALGHRKRLENYQASALAVIVLDLETMDVLGYVGSPDFQDEASQGQNDGVRALRQPGSTLKPFFYAAAVDLLGMNEDTQLSDEAESFAAVGGHFMPVNYDRRFRGKVSLRRALSNSLNVPAVGVLERVGPERSLEFLHRFGFASLDQPATVYGPALALGAGEVTLLELIEGYAALPNEGVFRRARFDKDGPVEPSSRACSPHAADLITRVLSDPASRREAFGATQNFEFPFQVAVKTGTSTGFRDAWVVGYSHSVAVAVWVGNFDGRPMQRGTGAGSAGPLFHDVMIRSEARALELWPKRAGRRERWGSAFQGAPAEAGAASPHAVMPRIIFPKTGMRFTHAPRSTAPELVLRAADLGPGGYFLVGTRRLEASPEGTAVLAAEPGELSIVAVRADGTRSESVYVTFE